MEMNQERIGGERILMPMCTRVINSDISEDLTLPDYYPEIRRVLYVRESPLPPSAFVGGSKIDVNGIMDYTLVYVSNDGSLCSAPLSAEYSFSVPLEGVSDFELGEGVTLMVHTFADNSNVRVSGPRRLTVRSHLRSGVNAWGRMLCEEELSGIGDPSCVERLMAETESAEIVCESSDLITIADRYTLPSQEHRIAMADGKVSVSGCRIDGEVARVSGEVTVCMTVICGDRSENVIRKIPFEADVELDGIQPSGDGLVRITGTITDLSLNVEEDSVDIEADMTLEMCYIQNRAVHYVKDAYSTEQRGEAVMRTRMLPRAAENTNLTISVNGSLSAEELGIPEGAKIVDVCGSAAADSIESGEEGCAVKGRCRYHIIYTSEGEYSHAEAELPFEHAVDADGEVCGFDAVATLHGCRARLDGGELLIESQLAVACTVLVGKEVEMLAEMSFSDMEQREKDQWTVVYVTPEDSSWSIAKRYGVRESDIKGDPVEDRYVLIER